MRKVVALVAPFGLLALLLGGCLSPAAPTWQGLGQTTLAELAAQRTEGHFAPFLVPYVVEAAVRVGLEPAEWPQGRPVADDLVVPNEPYFSTLRPTFARVLANPGDRDVESQALAAVLAGFDGRQFGDASKTLDDAFALFTLAALGAGSSAPAQAAAGFLAASANATGGWSYLATGTPDVDSTGIVVAALAAVGRPPPAGPVEAFLTRATSLHGGSGAAPGAPVNCQSTVWAIRAELALGHPVPAMAWSFLASLRVARGWSAHAGEAADAFCSVEVATLFGVAHQAGVPVPSAFSFE